ncbi:hypothetical protein T440DRAFT_224220 [Plenodomus tracheiphilus IPT5]|uniref:Uncharacterized protein n=1 Tax=Plenodomus tracheiphilus IPT5 TaxID=1408161 RepID=A0A6A7AU48_9PLEO|nr:hypothetical protein T440DRAFT_224220 [Plenodomus tracheiphilus IPT5]
MMQSDRHALVMITSPTLWPLLPIFGLDRSIGLFWCEEEETTHYSPRCLAFGLASVVLFRGRHMLLIRGSFCDVMWQHLSRAGCCQVTGLLISSGHWIRIVRQRSTVPIAVDVKQCIYDDRGCSWRQWVKSMIRLQWTSIRQMSREFEAQRCRRRQAQKGRQSTATRAAGCRTVDIAAPALMSVVEQAMA